MIHKSVAGSLRRTERDILIEHVDGSSDVPVQFSVSDRQTARNRLILKGLLRADRIDRPRKTIITEDGRQVLAYVLADYAEALVRAGYVGLASPIEPTRPRSIAITEPELAVA